MGFARRLRTWRFGQQGTAAQRANAIGLIQRARKPTLYAKTSTLIGDELIRQSHKQKDRLAAVSPKFDQSFDQAVIAVRQQSSQPCASCASVHSPRRPRSLCRTTTLLRELAFQAGSRS